MGPVLSVIATCILDVLFTTVAYPIISIILMFGCFGLVARDAQLLVTNITAPSHLIFKPDKHQRGIGKSELELLNHQNLVLTSWDRTTGVARGAWNDSMAYQKDGWCPNVVRNMWIQCDDWMHTGKHAPYVPNGTALMVVFPEDGGDWKPIEGKWTGDLYELCKWREQGEHLHAAKANAKYRSVFAAPAKVERSLLHPWSWLAGKGNDTLAKNFQKAIDAAVDTARDGEKRLAEVHGISAGFRHLAEVARSGGGGVEYGVVLESMFARIFGDNYETDGKIFEEVYGSNASALKFHGESSIAEASRGRGGFIAPAWARAPAAVPY